MITHLLKRVKEGRFHVRLRGDSGSRNGVVKEHVQTEAPFPPGFKGSFTPNSKDAATGKDWDDCGSHGLGVRKGRL